MQERIDLDDLRLVQAIGNAGSLSGAAAKLGLNHSSAFRRLGALEARLGARLFDRARTGYAPTPAGEATLATAARLLDELGDLERRLAGEDLRPSGVVRITTTDTLVEFLAPMLAAFRAAHPEIIVELVAANAFFTLTRRDADIAIRPSAQAPDNLVGRRIATLATALYAAPDYLARVARGLAPNDMDWLSPDESLAHLGSARWIGRKITEERIVFRANTLLGLLAAAHAGLGVAPLPCYLADPDPRLARVGGPLGEMASALWLLTHPDLRRVARVRVVLDFAAAWFAGQRELIEGRSKAASTGRI